MNGSAQLMCIESSFLNLGLHHCELHAFQVTFHFLGPKYLFQETLKHNTFVNTDIKQNLYESVAPLAEISLRL